MELSLIVAGVLGVIGCAYMLAFWGSAIFKGCYSYLQDGDKSVKDLCDWLYKKYSSGVLCLGAFDYFIYGALLPAIYAVFILLAFAITELTGILVPIILGGILGAFLLLYIMRAVIRLNKKLDRHSSDKNAHK